MEHSFRSRHFISAHYGVGGGFVGVRQSSNGSQKCSMHLEIASGVSGRFESSDPWVPPKRAPLARLNCELAPSPPLGPSTGAGTLKASPTWSTDSGAVSRWVFSPAGDLHTRHPWRKREQPSTRHARERGYEGSLSPLQAQHFRYDMVSHTPDSS